MFKLIFVFFSFLLFADCGLRENKVVISTYPNNKPQVEYTIIEGSKENLKKVKYKCFFENGNIMKTGMIINSKESGEWKYYYENGKISSKGNFNDGVRQGKAIRYYESGQIEQECEYLYNEIIDIKYYYRNGKLKPKPQENTLAILIKDKSEPWKKKQFDKISSRLKQEIMFNYKLSNQFCDCIVDSLSKHIEFVAIDTLTDYERGLLYGILIKKGYCASYK